MSEASSYVLNSDRWPGATTTFHVSIFNAFDGFVSPSGTTWDAAFIEAAGLWNASTPFTFSTISGSFSNPCDPFDLRNGVDFTFDVCGDAYGSTTLAVTLIFSAGPVTVTSETDIVFNGQASFFWDVYSGPWSTLPKDFRRVAAHELRHALGLDHSSSGSALMFPTVGNVETPQSDDIAGVNALYGGCASASGLSPDSVAVCTLSVEDCFLSEVGGSGNTLFDEYQLSLAQDGDLTIALDSTAFDAFLWLLDSALTVIATNDDGGGGTNSLITQSLAAGSYLILANSFFEGETGAYTLTTQFNPAHVITFTAPANGSPNPVASAGSVALSATASDSQGHALSYSWTASCPVLATNGSFSNPAVQSPNWTAPANITGAAQSCNIEVTASDGLGLDATSAYAQTVDSVPHGVAITSGPSGMPNPVASEGTASLSVAASDSLGHAINYAWSASCPGLPSNGSFSNPAVQSPNWTAPANTTGSPQSCNIEVTASDGLGLDDTGSYGHSVDSVPHTLAITTGPSGAPNPVASEGTASLSVAASDSLGHAINYAWSASCPGLPSNGSFSNPAVQSPNWTAPANTTGSPQSCNIEVTASDGLGLDDTGAFSQQVEAQSGPPAVPALSPPPRALLPFLLLGTALFALRRRQASSPN